METVHEDIEPGHSISYKIAYAPSEDSNKPSPRLRQVRVFGCAG